MILDGGPCKLGIESTVVSLAGPVPVLLRLGATPREEIERVLGLPLALAKPDDAIASPGQLATHYAPSTPLRLNVRIARKLAMRCSPSVRMCRRER